MCDSIMVQAVWPLKRMAYSHFDPTMKHRVCDSPESQPLISFRQFQWLCIRRMLKSSWVVPPLTDTIAPLHFHVFNA